MSNKTKFRLVNKSDNKLLSFTDAQAVGVYLWGRRIDNFIIIKSDETGDRIIYSISPNVNKIIKLCEIL